MLISARSLLHPDGHLRPGSVTVQGDRIAVVTQGWAPEADLTVEEGHLVPGLVDSHMHGGGAAAWTDASDASCQAIIDTHRRHGTTTLIASLVTDTIDEIERIVSALVPWCERGELAGIHLEGPWLSPCHKGAHDAQRLTPPTISDIDRLARAGQGHVVMATLAPELEGGIAAIQQLVTHGVTVALGHSDATYEVAREAISAGARCATHLGNAMRPVHHREPGLIVALLEDDAVAIELIADGVHVHPAVVRDVMALAGDRAVLITDAMAAAGAPDGDYLLGPMQVEVRQGVARIAGGGSIAGSTLTLDQAIRLCVQQAGVPLETALMAATATPARVHGLDAGVVAAGAPADLVVLGDDLQVRRVMRRGQWIADAPRTP